MKRCNKLLRVKNIYISHDLTQKQRSDNKILRSHLYLARQENKNRDCYLNGGKLFVDGGAYTADELEADVCQENRTNNAPHTPSVETSEESKPDPSTPQKPPSKKPNW
ncbi:unnamed protein product [Acanthoscelides obtectus]|uniref:Uncharacterized protein n=1 Tax=Acanthoscelides obtectus TaxID=200917 RepID=A0A9P0KK31_ACAOB|nr:unnamed protein product [Acanthoscelides obtectus]CAK1622088.1 hypothetical protein AOBTE_LOCUS1303 [Acanthoscelides obtectus]